MVSWRFPAELVTFTGEILHRKLHFLCSDFPTAATCNIHQGKKRNPETEIKEVLHNFRK